METEDQKPQPQLTEAQKVVIEYVDKNIDLIVQHLRDYCKKYKTTLVPIDYIISCATIQKGAFKSGVEKANAPDDSQTEKGG